MTKNLYLTFNVCQLVHDSGVNFFDNTIGDCFVSTRSLIPQGVDNILKFLVGCKLEQDR